MVGASGLLILLAAGTVVGGANVTTNGTTTTTNGTTMTMNGTTMAPDKDKEEEEKLKKCCASKSWFIPEVCEKRKSEQCICSHTELDESIGKKTRILRSIAVPALVGVGLLVVAALALVLHMQVWELNKFDLAILETTDNIMTTSIPAGLLVRMGAVVYADMNDPRLTTSSTAHSSPRRPPTPRALSDHIRPPHNKA